MRNLIYLYVKCINRCDNAYSNYDNTAILSYYHTPTSFLLVFEQNRAKNKNKNENSYSLSQTSRLPLTRATSH